MIVHLSFFALHLICGMSLMWTLMPRREITSGFFRIQMLVVLGLSVLAALGFHQASAELLVAPSGSEGSPAAAAPFAWLAGVSALTAISAFLGSVVWTLNRRNAGTVFVFLIAAVTTSCLATVGWAALGGLHVASELSTSLLLGAAVTGMLLGHWYLTAPTMSVAPLTRVTLYFGVAVAIRLVVSAALLHFAWDLVVNPSSSVRLVPWTWLSLRWLAGIIGPLAVFVMTWRILKYRNTQAATGVLFTGVILTFIGEMTAALIYQEVQRPF